LALRAWNEGARSLTGVDLARTVDLGVQSQLLTELCNPAWKTTDSKQYGEELGWEAHRTVDQAGVEVYVRVELAGYEVIISQSDLFELHSKVEKLVAAEVSKNLVGGFLRSEEHTSELQSRCDIVCRLLL